MKKIFVYLLLVRQLSIKKIICPLHLSKDDTTDILWKAIEFEKLFSSKSYYFRTKALKNKTLIFLSSEAKMQNTIPMQRATQLLKMNLKVITDKDWSEKICVKDVGLYLSHFADILVYSSRLHIKMKHMVNAAQIPVFCVQDCRFSLLDTLSDLMTFYQQFGYLEKLKIAWLGHPSKELNTLLQFASHFNLQVSYCCSCDPEKMISPITVFEAKKACKYEELLTECKTFEETIKGSHIIVTKHIDRTERHLGIPLLKDANTNWVYLRKLPRERVEHDENIFMDNKRCITWKSYKNNSWILISIIVKLLTKYNNVTPEPKFITK